MTLIHSVSPCTQTYWWLTRWLPESAGRNLTLIRGPLDPGACRSSSCMHHIKRRPSQAWVRLNARCTALRSASHAHMVLGDVHLQGFISKKCESVVGLFHHLLWLEDANPLISMIMICRKSSGVCLFLFIYLFCGICTKNRSVFLFPVLWKHNNHLWLQINACCLKNVF